MSLNEITRNCYQNGITAKKWLSLCKLFASKNAAHSTPEALQMEMCHSVLALLSSYPGDASLRRYLKTAVEDGFLPLHTFVSSFLLGVRSTELHDADTLDMLCRVALDSYHTSGNQPIGSLVSAGTSSADILTPIQLTLQLLRTASLLPITPLHPLHNSASELLYLLLSCVSDVSTIPTAHAFSFMNEAADALPIIRLPPIVRQNLENILLQLYQNTDDTRLALDTQVVHSQQFAGTGDIIGPSSESDIVSFSLLFQSLLLYRGREYGAGDGPHAVALLVSFHRLSSWNPATFYKQLLHSAINMLAHVNISSSGGAQYLITRAFITGRLPALLAKFEEVEVEGTKSDWRGAMHLAVPSLFQHSVLLQGCEVPLDPHASDSQNSNSSTSRSTSFIGELIHQFSEFGLVEQSFVSTMFPTQANEFHSKIWSEAHDAGLEIKAYLETKFAADSSEDDIAGIVQRILKDPCSHAAFSELILKWFLAQASPLDIEPLDHLCKILQSHPEMIDILSLHIKLSMLASPALALLEDYECDPQTAVSHLGGIVLFLQSILARFNLPAEKLMLGERKLNTAILTSAHVIYRVEELKGPESVSFHSWSKALFDSGSEGIEDGILRSTPPRTLLKLAATLVSSAIQSCSDRKIDKDVLNNGISFFRGPLLNWTLAGIVKMLLLEIQHRRFIAPLHLDVLQQLVTFQPFPKIVLHLSAGAILRLFTQSTPIQLSQTDTFDPTSIRRVALQTLGVSDESTTNTNLSLTSGHSKGHNSARELIQHALTDAATGKAPIIDVERCLLLMPPTQFLPALYSELAAIRQIETPRRIATHILATPRPSSSPPLLPIFLHVTLPTLITSIDKVSPTEQAIATDLLVAIISSALTAALHTEWALVSVCSEQRFVLGQSTTILARRLGGDLRRKAGKSPMSGAIARRLASSQPFVSNFPSFMAEV
ncbi:unnamed protein product [Somion occarium]|uniref:Mediator of RNA polymerase II transcription subunit 5 n=1 Tax=Somion occarium TaxID=3059160 RepID=A0ABP1CIA7_9APHY